MEDIPSLEFIALVTEDFKPNLKASKSDLLATVDIYTDWLGQSRSGRKDWDEEPMGEFMSYLFTGQGEPSLRLHCICSYPPLMRDVFIQLGRTGESELPGIMERLGAQARFGPFEPKVTGALTLEASVTSMLLGNMETSRTLAALATAMDVNEVSIACLAMVTASDMNPEMYREQIRRWSS